MVCNLSGTDRTGALKPKSRTKMLKFLREGAEGDSIPDEWLADFKTLLEWIQDEKRRSDGVTWHPSGKQVDRLSMLHEFRNTFSHYVPKSWSIEASGLPTIIETALDGTDHLMLNSSCVLMQITVNQKRALEHSLKRARLGLAAVREKVSG